MGINKCRRMAIREKREKNFNYEEGVNMIKDSLLHGKVTIKKMIARCIFNSVGHETSTFCLVTSHIMGVVVFVDLNVFCHIVCDDRIPVCSPFPFIPKNTTKIGKVRYTWINIMHNHIRIRLTL
jgi:hypothetical protein